MDIRMVIMDDKLLVNKLEGTMNWEKSGITLVFTMYNILQDTVIEIRMPRTQWRGKLYWNWKKKMCY